FLPVLECFGSYLKFKRQRYFPCWGVSSVGESEVHKWLAAFTPLNQRVHFESYVSTLADTKRFITMFGGILSSFCASFGNADSNARDLHLSFTSRVLQFHGRCLFFHRVQLALHRCRLALKS